MEIIFKAMTIKKWKVVSREIVYKNKYNRNIEKVAYELQNKKIHDFYIKKEGRTVAIFALTNDKKIILGKEYRPGPHKIGLDIVGGGIHKNETVRKAAARELLEETGYAGKLKIVAELPVQAYSTGRQYCVVATDCEKIQEASLDPTEFIEVKLLSLSQFRAFLRKGKIMNASVGYLALDYLKLL